METAACYRPVTRTAGRAPRCRPEVTCDDVTDGSLDENEEWAKVSNEFFFAADQGPDFQNFLTSSSS